ncbi:hypothetical protein BO85DRAFT_449177 [Aspergillus piperis CBS 112811]|uniref:Uncharacterized protein n=1 Tax=Aspergillus piperis CBS 112811 TaxID=1448313 RepID=A0A8G1R287_9EURO|nr:hypothetical protein BO85DRAFT_449177 [Aspergillus piperis CBS 112811]RAH58074.1 hypothetical protein BO85DRAFT_449177 [Aspergillus piperis CBS 112811]
MPKLSRVSQLNQPYIVKSRLLVIQLKRARTLLVCFTPVSSSLSHPLIHTLKIESYLPLPYSMSQNRSTTCVR